MDIFNLSNDKNSYSFNTYLLYEEGKFTKNKRQEFLNKIKKEFDVKDEKISYSRCHSVSYASIVSAIINIFNLVLDSKNGNIKLSYNDCINVAIQYLSGLVLAVKKYPLLLSNDYNSMSIQNNYSEIIGSNNVKLSFIKYAISKNLILKLIFRLLNNPNDVDFIDHLLDYGNILVEKLNNCHMNLRVGPSKYNSAVHEYYDVISFKSCKDGIIIDNEMDCCALSHVKHIMYPIEDDILHLDNHAINLPDMFIKNGQYEIMTSFQVCDETKNHLKDRIPTKAYFYDWYTKDKGMIIL